MINTDNTMRDLAEGLKEIQALKDLNPEEYATKLSDYIESLKEFNENTKRLLESLQS